MAHAATLLAGVGGAAMSPFFAQNILVMVTYDGPYTGCRWIRRCVVPPRIRSVRTESTRQCSVGFPLPVERVTVQASWAGSVRRRSGSLSVADGIPTSSFTGRAVRSLMAGDPAPVDLKPFRADRFDGPSGEFQVHGIAAMAERLPSGETDSDQPRRLQMRAKFSSTRVALASSKLRSPASKSLGSSATRAVNSGWNCTVQSGASS